MKPKFDPSVQQQALFNWIVNGEGSALVVAVAGSGKTTTLIHSLSLMNGSIFFGAYNKKISEEIAERAPPKFGLVISTMHGAGFKMWRTAYRNVKVVDDKCRRIFREACLTHPDYAVYEDQVLSLVSYAKQAGVGILKSIDDMSVWLEMIEHFNIDCLGDDTAVVKLARRLLLGSIKRDHLMIDFDDMIFAPLYHGCKCDQYDWVLIDEAQDTNASRRALALMMLKRGGRLIAVGDPHQAIYGFTGADADSLDLIAIAVNAQRFPLSVSFRCPRAVVKYAQTWVSHIESANDAPEGSVTHLPEGVKVTSAAVPGDVILCRFNAPLIKQVYEFIAEGIPAKVEGREIGSGLKALVRRWKSKNFDALISNLETYAERETAKYRAKEQEAKAAAIDDKVNCLKVIIQRAITKATPGKPAEVVCAEIDAIFADTAKNSEEVKVVTLSSIHKSKGREWNRVFWMQTGPSKWARKDWELQQEDNLCYVAATRAKEELILYPVPA